MPVPIKVVSVPIDNEGLVPVPIIVVPVLIDRRGLVPVSVKVVPVPMLPTTLFLHAMQC